MKKKLTGGINVGTSSILVTFVLLCLVTFAALSFLSANSDYRLSKQAAERTTEFYGANNYAEIIMADIEKQLSTAHDSAASEEEYISSIPTVFSSNDSVFVDTDSDSTTLSYDVPINDTQNLHVCLSVNSPSSDDSALFHISEWQTQTKDIWEDEGENATLLDDGDVEFMTFN